MVDSKENYKFDLGVKGLKKNRIQQTNKDKQQNGTNTKTKRSKQEN